MGSDRIIAASLLIVVLSCGGAGAPGSAMIRFDEVASGPMAEYREEQSRILIGADAAGKAELERLTGQRLSGDVLIGVLMGERPTGGFSVAVDSIRREGDNVIVNATFARPASDAIVIQVLTSPFTVVSVPRADLPRGTVRFSLRDVSGQEVSRAEIRNP